MAIKIDIKNLELFIEDVRYRIDNKSIETWSYDQDGDFTHCVNEWLNIAWFHPYILNDNTIIFGIVGRQGVKISMSEYSFYHGRFVEMLLCNYYQHFNDIECFPPFKCDYDTRFIDSYTY